MAPEGFRILAADYSQIELRIMAHLSGDQGLLSAFSAGLDIHRATAAEVFGVFPDLVDREQRRVAKAVNFGGIYGQSAFGLSQQLKIGRNVAQGYIDSYFARYEGVALYMQQVIEEHHPPSVKGKHIKIKYVTQLPTHTPTFAFFCNFPKYIKNPYVRYLENRLRENFGFDGVAQCNIKKFTYSGKDYIVNM